MTILSLFSGVGGIDCAVEHLTGYPTTHLVERDPFCQRVLRRHFPGVPIIEMGATLSAWPTPRGEDSEQTGGHRGSMDTLTSAARLWASPQAHDERGALNPEFSGWLMGAYPGWTIPDGPPLPRTINGWNRRRYWPGLLPRPTRAQGDAAAHDRPRAPETTSQGARKRRCPSAGGHGVVRARWAVVASTIVAGGKGIPG